jgi:hypothetical protein
MKFQLSPFIVLFISLNTILIFCATRKVDSEKKPSSSLTQTDEDTRENPNDNFDASAKLSSIKYSKLPAAEVNYYIGYMIYEKEHNELNSILETSAKTNLDDDLNEQKSKDL